MTVQKIRRTITAFLAVATLAVSTAFVASAIVSNPVETSGWFTVGNGGGFTGYLTSMPNASSTVVSQSFRASGTTGITLTTTSSRSGNFAFGKVVSLKQYDQYITISPSPLIVMRHAWSNSGNNVSTTLWSFGHPAY